VSLSEGFEGTFQADEDHRDCGAKPRVLFRPGEPRTCPDCGSSQWIIGRRLAECGHCSAAIPLAEVKLNGAGAFRSRHVWWRPREARSYLIHSGASFAVY
jgi:hypothetical protein